MKFHTLTNTAIPRVAAIAVFMALLANPGEAQAGESESTGSETISLSLGMFFADRKTDTRLDASAGDPGSDLDLEADLGFKRKDSVFRLDGYYKFNDRHRIDFSAFDLSRSSSKTLETDIEWDGNIYPIDTPVDAKLDLTIYKLAYTWSFVRSDKAFLGLTGGLYVADLGAFLNAPEITLAGGGAVTAPLPVLGLRGEYEFAENWKIRGSSEFFSFSYQEYDGTLYDIYAGIDYKAFKNTSIGLGVNTVRMDIGVSDSDLNANLDWRYSGALIFFKFDF